MRDIILYVGSSPEDCATISAGYTRLGREIELHFLTTPEDLLSRLDVGQAAPAVIFLTAPADREQLLKTLLQLKSCSAFCWTPVVLIAEDADRWTEADLTAAGAAAVLRQPVEIDALQRLFTARGELLFRPFEHVHARE